MNIFNKPDAKKINNHDSPQYEGPNKQKESVQFYSKLQQPLPPTKNLPCWHQQVNFYENSLPDMIKKRIKFASNTLIFPQLFSLVINASSTNCKWEIRKEDESTAS